MAELTDHQLHLSNLKAQQKELISQANLLSSEVTSKREMILKVQGAIEYLQQIGVSVPETEINEEIVEEQISEEDE